MRTLTVFTLLLSCAAVHAQPQSKPVKGVFTFQMTVSPARPLEPLSRVMLMPHPREQWHGNAVQAFLDCFSEQTALFRFEEDQKRAKYLELPFGDPGLKVQLPTLKRRLHDAARFNHADWQQLQPLRKYGIEALLPGEQYMRRHAQVLAVQARYEIAIDRPLDAVETIADTLVLARIFRDHPSLIGNLVGIAIAQLGLRSTHELIQHPDCPNLYWAVTALPDPLFQLHQTVAAEMMLFDEFRPLLTEVLSDDQLIDHIHRLLRVSPMADGSVMVPEVAKLMFESTNKPKIAERREELVRLGIDAGLVMKMSPLQVVCAHDYRLGEVERDEQALKYNLPFWQLGTDPTRPGESDRSRYFGPMLIAAYSKIFAANARLAQTVAVTRTIEALRFHAAEKGEFPESLADCTLPVPADPVSGKPFAYKLDGGKAVLTTADALKLGVPGQVFEITLRN